MLLSELQWSRENSMWDAALLGRYARVWCSSARHPDGEGMVMIEVIAPGSPYSHWYGASQPMSGLQLQPLLLQSLLHHFATGLPTEVGNVA